MTALRVEIWSDIACPWCWVGKRHLQAAIAELPDEVDVEVVWRAFELDPAAPTAYDPDPDTDYVLRLARKYGATRAHAESMIDGMVRVGAKLGLDFRFDRISPGNTFDAHRLLHWASKHARQDALKERLFAAYMHEGRSVSDHGVLVELAADVGLDAEAAQGVLCTDAHAADVRREQARASELGVTGVPFFMIGGRFAVPGAQPAELLLRAMREAAALGNAEGTAVDGEQAPVAADVCGADGCAVPSP